MDLSESCIEHCRQRFDETEKLHLYVNDGRSLPVEVADGCVDLVFSFDSLVHCEFDVLEAYIKEIGRKLRPGGAAFIHHSNLGEYSSYFRVTRLVPYLIRARLERARLIDNCHWRGITVTAKKVADLCASQGMQCLAQECIPWTLANRTIDCMSIIYKPDSESGSKITPNEVWYNRDFMAEARIIKGREALYRRMETLSKPQSEAS